MLYLGEMEVSCLKDSNGEYLLTNPSIDFKGNICCLVEDADPQNYTVYQEIDLYDHTEDTWYLGGLIEAINSTGYFSATLLNNTDL